MIRRLVLIALSLAVLGGCATYDRGYRYAAPSEAGYGDYYYDPTPAPVYVVPSYLRYPAYSSLYWGLDRHYYSPWYRPGFHYGVTWFPNDWFAFSVINRYPIGHRYGRGFGYGYGYYGHPFSPYRYSYYDHRYHGRYRHAQRNRHVERPRYGHPSNERYADRERIRQVAEARGLQGQSFDRRVGRDAVPRDAMRGPASNGRGDAGGPGTASLPSGASVGRARAAAMDAARPRNAASVSDRPASMGDGSARPWRQDGAHRDAMRSPSDEASRRIPRDPAGERRMQRPQDAGRVTTAREAALLERQRATSRTDQVPRRIERDESRAAPMRRQAENADVQAAPSRMPARAQIQQRQQIHQRQQSTLQERRATRPQQVPQRDMSGSSRAPMRQAMPQRAPASAAPAARAPRQARPAAATPQRAPAPAPARAVRQAPAAAPAPRATPRPAAAPRPAPSRRAPREAVQQER